VIQGDFGGASSIDESERQDCHADMDADVQSVLGFAPRSEAMDKLTIEMLARRAGLQKALAEFPDDVEAAARQAAAAVENMKPPEDPRAEPWPPMRVGDGL
jgi:hypothetical protein